MIRIKIVIATLSVLSFAMLTACGEGFKGAELMAQANHPQVNLPEDQIPASNVQLSVHEQAVSGLQSIVEGATDSSNQSLALSVTGLSMVREDYSSGASADQTSSSFFVTMSTGCESSDQIRMGGIVDMAALKDGENVSLGADRPYQMFLTCTDSECDSVVVTIRKFSHHGTSAIAHFAMENHATINQLDFSTAFEYVSRRTDASNFFFKGTTVAAFQELCLQADAERAVGGNLSSGAVSEAIFGGNGSGTQNPSPFFEPQQEPSESLPFFEESSSNWPDFQGP